MTDLVAARAIGLLAQRLFEDHISHLAGIEILSHPAATVVLAQIQRENVGPAIVPIREILRSDGTAIVYHLGHYVGTGGTTEARDRSRLVSMAGAFLTLGDALAVSQYLDHKPDLELIRHVRNGIAHGNKFNLVGSEPRRPAYFYGPDQRLSGNRPPTPVGLPTYFVVTPALNGTTVLFDFMGEADLLDLLQHVSWRLLRLGNGDPEHDLHDQTPRPA